MMKRKVSISLANMIKYFAYRRKCQAIGNTIQEEKWNIDDIW